MGKSLSITVHPAALGAEYLSVSDAMRQVLDMVEALERTDSTDPNARQIVWRLTEAHTNSPPFTVTVQAFAVNPVISIGLEASRLTSMFGSGLRDLLDGDAPDWIEPEIAIPLKRAFERNFNGVGRTEIAFEDQEPFNVLPSNAKVAVITLERLALDVQAEIPDYSRTEYGAVEVEVQGLAKWNDKPALNVIERLSRDKVTCVLSPEVADLLGPQHKWNEVWEGRRLLASGALHYGRDGSLKRIDAESVDDMPWTDVLLSDLRSIDILNGRSVAEHLALIRGSDFA